MSKKAQSSTSTEIDSLFAETEQCLLKDKIILRRKLGKLAKSKNRDDKPNGLEKLSQEVNRRKLVYEQRLAAIPEPGLNEDLPISRYTREIIETLESNQVLVLAGETGSGKSTQLPLMCLLAGRGRQGFIGHTQPRRLAAKSISARLSQELNSAPGEKVSYKIRFDDKSHEQTLIKVMTDGILLTEIRHDRFLNQYDTLIIDESHERSLNIDFLLGYLKKLLPRRPDLKLIITSATINTKKFSEFFNGAPVISVEGKTYPVEVIYRDIAETKSGRSQLDRDDELIRVMEEIVSGQAGDVLVFLNGEREIMELQKKLRRHFREQLNILPLFSRLSASEQSLIFSKSPKRKIILSTNIAETSITVPNIRYVLDCGTARISRYNPVNKIQRLPIEKISRASADQRKGRCGRVSEGVCYRLYSEEDYEQRDAYTDPEIVRTNLASVILQMKFMGLGDIEAFDFLDAPDTRQINFAYSLLYEINALDEQQNLTPLGRQLARIPVDPRLGRMILAGSELGAVVESVISAACLSIQSPFDIKSGQNINLEDEKYKPFFDNNSDFMFYIKLWQALAEQLGGSESGYIGRKQKGQAAVLRKFCKQYQLSYLRMMEWQDLVRQLFEVCKDLKLNINHSPAKSTVIHQAIFHGFFSNIAFRHEDNEYEGIRNLKFHLHRGSCLNKKAPKWLMYAGITETQKVFAYTAARIDPQWIEKYAAHLLRQQIEVVYWEKNSDRVVAEAKYSMYGLAIPIRKKLDYSRKSRRRAREVFIREGVLGNNIKYHLDFVAHNNNLISRIHYQEARIRRRDLLVSDEKLWELYDAMLPDVVNAAELRRWYKGLGREEQQQCYFLQEQLLNYELPQELAESYPESYAIDGTSFTLSYHFEPGSENDGVSLQVPLEQLDLLAEEPLQYIVPAWLDEKIETLLRQLPKAIRRNLQPITHMAQQLRQSYLPHSGQGLLEVCCQVVWKLKGCRITPADFDVSQLPAHLRLGVEVLDGDKLIAGGKDWSRLKAQCQRAFDDKLSDIKQESIKEHHNATSWDFGDLPEIKTIKQGQRELKLYTTLEDREDCVAIEYLANQEQSRQLHRQGVKRLYQLQSKSKLTYVRKNLPMLEQTLLNFSNIYSRQQFIQDLLDHNILGRIDACSGKVLKLQEYQSLQQALDSNIVNDCSRSADLLNKSSDIYRQIFSRLADLKKLYADAVADIQEQLSALVFKGFIREVPEERLQYYPRYLQAILLRMDKLPQNPQADAKWCAEIQQVILAYKNLKDKLEKNPAKQQQIRDIFWSIQELRVSLFAQTLGTKEKVSVKRILSKISQAEIS